MIDLIEQWQMEWFDKCGIIEVEVLLATILDHQPPLITMVKPQQQMDRK